MSMSDFSQFIPEHIRRLAAAGESKPLKQGASVEDNSTSRLIQLNLNENPFGPSPKAIAALQKAMAEVHRYPEINATDLHQQVAAFHDVAPEQVLVTAGATELLCMIARALLGPGLNAVTSAKSFIVYRLATQVTEGKLIEVPTSDNGYDLEAIANTIDRNTRIVFIANPNNPTGTILSADEIDDLVDRLPEHVLLVLDEAYGDFAEAFTRQRGVTYSRALDYIRRDKNVILLKTFSKAHGLAGLRVGYGIGPARLISLLAPMRVIFSVSSVAQAAAAAALHDHDHVRRAIENNLSESETLSLAMRDLGCTIAQTWANFLYCELKEGAARFAERLRARGVIVQPLAGWGSPNAIRVSIGTPEQNQIFIAAMTMLAGRHS